jgi:hypothetical protein
VVTKIAANEEIARFDGTSFLPCPLKNFKGH